MNTWSLRRKDKGSHQAECAADEQHGIHRSLHLDHKSFTGRDSESDILKQPLALPVNSRCSVSCVLRDFLFEGHFVCPLITMKLTEGVTGVRGTAASVQYVPCIPCSRNFMNIPYSNQCSSGVLGPGTPSDFLILGFILKPLLLLI